MANALVTAGVLLSASGESGGFSIIAKGMSNLITLATTMLTGITSNDILATFFVAGFAGTILALLSQMKHT